MALIPSIVPRDDDTVYIVEDDFGTIGQVWRETDSRQTDRATTTANLYRGEFNNPVRVVAFNVREGWSRDVSHELAVELQRRLDLENEQPFQSLAYFIEDHARPARQLSLRRLA